MMQKESKTRTGHLVPQIIDFRAVRESLRMSDGHPALDDFVGDLAAAHKNVERRTFGSLPTKTMRSGYGFDVIIVFPFYIDLSDKQPAPRTCSSCLTIK
jgi:hypothetical protein